jgi:TPR repeat protein
MFALGAIFAAGRHVATDRQIAQRWFRVAAERGHGHAQMMLGRYLLNGLAGDLNPAEGRMWLERAVAQGIADAEHDLNTAPVMTGAPSN